MSTTCNYLPTPSRVWSRVQNPCTFTVPGSTYTQAYIPLTKQTVSQAQANYEDKLLYKGNILQHKGNSSRLTKSQKYTQLAKGFGPNRTKVFASQSQTYTNPNTTGLQRVNYSTIPFPNTVVGEPNNISGPYQYNVTNPNGCSGTSLQDGGTLVCGTLANPCTGEIIRQGATSSVICNPASASDVPGSSILCWNNKVQSWFPKQRYVMNNSTDKWPVNYKEFISAIKFNSRPGFTNGGSSFVVPEDIPEDTPLVVPLVVPLFVLEGVPEGVPEGASRGRPKSQFVAPPSDASRGIPKSQFVAPPSDASRGIPKSKIVTQIAEPNGLLFISDDINPFINQNVTSFIPPPVITTDCCTFINRVYNNDSLITINEVLVKSIKNILNLKDITNLIDLNTFNELKINLENYKDTLDPKSCLNKIVDTFENVSTSLYLLYNIKNQLLNQITIAEQYQNSDKILKNRTLLQEYLDNINKSIYIADLNIKSHKASLKPKYAIYHTLYGIPDNLLYDSTILNSIIKTIDIYHSKFGTPTNSEYNIDDINSILNNFLNLTT